METEALSDFGFREPESGGAFFETAPDDLMRPYQPLSSLDPGLFDVILVGDINDENTLLSRLNGCPTKVVPAAPVCSWFHRSNPDGCKQGIQNLSESCQIGTGRRCYQSGSSGGVIVEAGVYMGGTTLFISRLQRLLGAEPHICARYL